MLLNYIPYNIWTLSRGKDNGPATNLPSVIKLNILGREDSDGVRHKYSTYIYKNANLLTY